MTKYVVNNSQVKHLWANRSQIEARGNGSTHFYGPTLYSYNTPIAHFYQHGKHECALITTVSYSVSTSQHMPSVLDVPRVPAFRVKHIGVSAGRAPALPSNWISENYLDMSREYGAALERLLKCRSENRMASAQAAMMDLKTRAMHYAAFFKLRYKHEKYFPALSEGLIKKTAERVEKATAQRKKQAGELAERMKVKRAAQLAAYLKNEADLPYDWQWSATDEQRAQAEAHRPAYEAEMVRRWKQGEGSGVFHTIDGRVWLRLAKRVLGDPVTGDETEIEPDTVETSRGADFPLAHGLKALPLIRACVERGEVWERNGKTIRLGEFQVDRIEADGTVKAGCHTVPYSEVEYIAAEVGA